MSGGAANLRDFYDELAPYYHLIYQDWQAGIARQGEALDRIIREAWGSGVRRVLDAACGIGTQALGLAGRGYEVTASDLSPAAVERARREAGQRGLRIDFSVADLRQLATHHGREFDVVLACDNVLPLLGDDAGILAALRQLHACTRPGGGCVVSVRDYESLEGQPLRLVPHQVHTVGPTRYVLFQVWELAGSTCDVSLYVVEDRGEAGCTTRVLRTRTYAVSISRLLELMREAGWRDLRRLDGAFFQPVLTGARAAAESR